MIEEADFQKVGNAAIDLCVFVDKLRLGEKHREEADELTHNILNLIKQTEKIKEEPLTKGNKMSKKPKIQFWKADKVLCMQSALKFKSNTERDACLKRVVNAITDELFTGEGELKVGEMCEVWHPADLEWQEGKLLAILPENYEERFIVMNLCDPDRYAFFSVARPLAKRTEPNIEECGQLITYTWEEK